MKIFRRTAFCVVMVSGLATTTGCMRSYTITMGDQPAQDAHYVLVQTRANGNMKVYDCQSYPDDEWKPTCVRAKMRTWAGGRGDAPEELVDE